MRTVADSDRAAHAQLDDLEAVVGRVDCVERRDDRRFC